MNLLLRLIQQVAGLLDVRALAREAPERSLRLVALPEEYPLDHDIDAIPRRLEHHADGYRDRNGQSDAGFAAGRGVLEQHRERAEHADNQRRDHAIDERAVDRERHRHDALSQHRIQKTGEPTEKSGPPDRLSHDASRAEGVAQLREVIPGDGADEQREAQQDPAQPQPARRIRTR